MNIQVKERLWVVVQVKERLWVAVVRAPVVLQSLSEDL